MKKYFREMDVSSFPSSSNIVDKRNDKSGQVYTVQDWRERNIKTPASHPGQTSTPQGDTSGASPSSPGTPSTWRQTHRGYGSTPAVPKSPVTNIDTIRQTKSQAQQDIIPSRTTYSNPHVKVDLNEPSSRATPNSVKESKKFISITETIKKIVKQAREKEKLNKK